MSKIIMKKIKFYTLSQVKAEDKHYVEHLTRTAKSPIIISITSPTEEKAKIRVSIPLLRLEFDDIEYKESHQISNYPLSLFTREQAIQILEFVNKYKPDTIITHCKAGICRSAAVNAALSKIMMNEDDIFFQEKIPNMLVYTTILNYWYCDLLEYSENHKEISAKHLYPYVYNTRCKLLPKLH